MEKMNFEDIKVKQEQVSPANTYVPTQEKETTLVELTKQFKIIQEQIAEQQKIINSQNEVINSLNSKKDGSSIIGDKLANYLENNSKHSNSFEVKVYNLTDYAQCQYKLSDGTVLTFTKYGEFFPITLTQAQLLINKFYKSFKIGALCFDADHMYLIQEKGIDTSKINYKVNESLENINKLLPDELEKLFLSLSTFQREMLKDKVYKGFIDNKDYMTLNQIKALNEASKKGYLIKEGTFSRLMSDVLNASK